MTTIGAKPPEPARTAAAALPSSIGRPSAVEPVKERGKRPDDKPLDNPDTDKKPALNADELSDEFLLKVVRGFAGAHGTIVDKSV